jgi:hypothetical protein
MKIPETFLLAKSSELHPVKPEQVILGSQPEVTRPILNQGPDVLIVESVCLAFKRELLTLKRDTTRQQSRDGFQQTKYHPLVLIGRSPPSGSDHLCRSEDMG